MTPDAPEGLGWRRMAANPELAFATILLVLLVSLSSLQVVLRYVFNAPLPWTEEISGMALVWMTYSGAVGLARRNLHARVELLQDIAGEARWLKVLDVFLDLLSVVFLVVVTVGAVDLISQFQHERTPALRLPITLQIAAVPISTAAMALLILWRNVQTFRGRARS